MKKILVSFYPGKPTLDFTFKNKFPEDDLYVGGEIRMKAALQLLSKYDFVIFIGESRDKLNHVKQHLALKYIPQNKIVYLLSNPDTNGNLQALSKFLDECNIDNSFHIDFLSNQYHEERLTLMAKTIIKKNEWNFIAAESLEKEEAVNAENIYKESYNKRLKFEKKGIEDWKRGECKDQHRPESDYVSIVFK